MSPEGDLPDFEEALAKLKIKGGAARQSSIKDTTTLLGLIGLKELDIIDKQGGKLGYKVVGNTKKEEKKSLPIVPGRGNA